MFKIQKPNHCLITQNHHRLGSQFFLFLNLAFVVERDGTLLDEQEAWPWLLNQFPNTPFDQGFKKGRGTYGVVGNAFALQPVAQMKVEIQFDALFKSIFVFGDRHWQQGFTGWTISSPQAFSFMPVRADHAYGGADYALNPLGKGFNAAGEVVGQPLPNLELPNALIFRPEDKPEPALTGLLPLTSPAKQKWLGAVSDEWLQQDFPWLPRETNLRWFDGVPEDQIGQGYWKGTESWSISGMHLFKDKVQGQLPGLRPRLLVGSQFATEPKEVELVLDTVWLAPNDERAIMWYRGAVVVQREDAADIDQVLIYLESQNDIKHSPAQIIAFWQNQSDVMDAVDAPSIATGHTEVVNEVLLAELEAKSHEIVSSVQTGLDDAQAQMNQKLNELGLGSLAKTESSVSTGAVLQLAEIRKEDLETIKKTIKGQIDQGLSQAQALMDEHLRKMEQQFGIELISLKPLPKITEKLLASSLTEIINYVNTLPVDAAIKEKMTGELASLQTNIDSLEAHIAAIKKRLLEQYPLQTRSVDSFDAVLSGEQADGVEFVDLTVRESALGAIHLKEKVWRNCRFVGVCFSETDLSSSLFEDCWFEECDFQGSVWNDVDFSRCRFDQIKAQAVSLVNVSFNECVLTRFNADHALLTRVTFAYSELVETRFNNADLQRASFMETKAIGTLFRRAHLKEMRVDLNSVLNHCDFSQAQCQQSSWQESSLKNSCFNQANLDSAFFRQCDLSNSKGVLMEARQSSFSECVLTGSEWQGANLMQSAFAHMSLDQLVWEGVNAFELEGRTAEIGRVSLLGALLTRSVFEQRGQ